MSMSVSCVAGYDQRGAVGGRGELVTVCPRQGSTCRNSYAAWHWHVAGDGSAAF